MSGRLTVWGAGQLLTCYFNKTSEPPATFYLALVRTVAPTPYIEGAELDEPDNDDYARVPIPNDLANWVNDSQPQEIYNALPAAFVTATSDWGQINYWALCDAPIEGNNFMVGDLETPQLIMTGDQPAFDEGDLSVSLGPFYLIEEA